MATYSKQFLSGSLSGAFSSGGPILISGTNQNTMNVVHQTSTNTTSIIDEVWIYASNIHTSSVVLTIVFDNSEIKLTIPPQSGLVLVVPGLLIRGNGESPGFINAYASTTNVISVSGYVNRIS